MPQITTNVTWRGGGVTLLSTSDAGPLTLDAALRVLAPGAYFTDAPFTIGNVVPNMVSLRLLYDGIFPGVA